MQRWGKYLIRSEMGRILLLCIPDSPAKSEYMSAPLVANVSDRPQSYLAGLAGELAMSCLAGWRDASEHACQSDTDQVKKSNSITYGFENYTEQTNWKKQVKTFVKCRFQSYFSYLITKLLLLANCEFSSSHLYHPEIRLSIIKPLSAPPSFRGA